MNNFFKILSFRLAILVTVAAVIFLYLGYLFEINAVRFLFLLLFFIVSFFLIKSFFKKIRYFYENELLKLRKKLQKDKKFETLEEISRKKTEEIAQLKANERFRKEFIGNVAHELKTPIFNIEGFISTLLDGAIDDPNVNVKYLERTDKNVQRLIALVKDLDTISKLETGVIVPDYKKINIVDVVKEVFDVLEVKSSEFGVNLVCKYEEPIVVYADIEKITEVIHNLVLNSIIYGKKEGTTEVIIKEKKKKVLVLVKDNGIGINEEDQKHIFERFFRVDKSRSRERGGSGLGLAIVKHIIDSHNQKISVESKVGVGTTFVFSLAKSKEY